MHALLLFAPLLSLAQIWEQLRSNRMLIAERMKFAAHLEEKGLGQLEGTRWKSRISEDSTVTEARMCISKWKCICGGTPLARPDSTITRGSLPHGLGHPGTHEQ